MSDQNSDLDGLLRRNAEQQLKDFDWDRLGARISGRLGQAASPDRFQRRLLFFRMAPAAAAAAAVVVLGVMCYRWASPAPSPSLLEQIMAGRLDAGSLGSAPGETDSLIAGTSPGTILLTGQTHLVCSDPLLVPHSIWDQTTASVSAQTRVKEKWQ